jgi:hypothetical protein
MVKPGQKEDGVVGRTIFPDGYYAAAVARMKRIAGTVESWKLVERRTANWKLGRESFTDFRARKANLED